MLSHVVRRNANVCGTKWLRRASAPQSPIQTIMALQTLLYHTPNWKSHRLMVSVVGTIQQSAARCPTAHCAGAGLMQQSGHDLASWKCFLCIYCARGRKSWLCRTYQAHSVEPSAIALLHQLKRTHEVKACELP